MSMCHLPIHMELSVSIHVAIVAMIVVNCNEYELVIVIGCGEGYKV